MKLVGTPNVKLAGQGRAGVASSGKGAARRGVVNRYRTSRAGSDPGAAGANAGAPSALRAARRLASVAARSGVARNAIEPACLTSSSQLSGRYDGGVSGSA